MINALRYILQKDYLCTGVNDVLFICFLLLIISNPNDVFIERDLPFFANEPSLFIKDPSGQQVG